MTRSDRSPDSTERSPLIQDNPPVSQDDGIQGPPIFDESLHGGRYSEEGMYQPEEPLLPATDPAPLDLEDSTVQSKSAWYLMLLTLSIGGLQIVWSVELSNGSPYLLSLGMSKALLAFVWLAGPMTGVLVQPYIGIRSDRCRVPWGKRKPFMIAGTLGTIASSMILAYARDIVGLFAGPDAEYSGGYKTATIILATIMMWCLDFAINTVQAAIRAFIVDNAPSHQQESANAWASRMAGIGNVLGYIFGYLDLPRYLHFFGDTQFKGLVVIASVALSSTVLVSVIAITERNPQLDPPSRTETSGGLLDFFKQVFVSMKRLPPQVRKVCEIQFFHWIGWFPFLFYITTYIGQLYVNPYLERQPDLPDDEVERLWAKATRVGTLALLIYAITSFGANIILPFLVLPAYKATVPESTASAEDPIARPITPTSPIGTRAAWDGHHSMHRSQSSLSIHGSTGIGHYLRRIQIPGFTLRRAWLLSQLLFVVCTWSTVFISTPLAATVMTAVIGISWSLTLWAPFALISADISQRDELRRRKYRQRLAGGLESGDDSKEDEEEDQAGIILGLHNVAISAPQILATLMSSAVFKALQKPRNEPGDVSVGWTLRIGGLATLVAAFITWRMKEPGEEEDGR